MFGGFDNFFEAFGGGRGHPMMRQRRPTGTALSDIIMSGKTLRGAANEGDIRTLRNALQNGANVNDQNGVCLYINIIHNE